MSNRTLEQEQYISELLKKKNYPKKLGRPRKVKRETPTKWNEPKTSRTDYMRNCIFWIDEFLAGRTDREKLNNVLNSLQAHINTIRIETNPNSVK